MSVLLVIILLVCACLVWFAFEKKRRRTYPVVGGINRDIALAHTQPFELYGNAFSHCSRKTRLILAELEIPYRHINVDLIETGSYETISPHFLRINPAGLIPVLVHDGYPVYESDDIMRHAVACAGPSAIRLLPANEHLRRQVDEWLGFCALSSKDPTGGKAQSMGACVPGLTLPLFAAMIQHVPVHRIAVGLLFHPEKKRPIFFFMARLLGIERIVNLPAIAATISASRDTMRYRLLKVDRALLESNGDWILGEQFSLADITLGCVLLRLEETGWLDQFGSGGDLNNVLSYYARLRSRPSWGIAIEGVRNSFVERGVADLASYQAGVSGHHQALKSHS